jgi:hypothetical protein
MGVGGQGSGVRGLTRRSMLAAGCGVVAALGASADDDPFLDDLSRRCFRYFWEQSDPHTGITRGRSRADGSPYPVERRDVGSTGDTGFGITAMCIGAERGWITRAQARERVRNTLKAYADGPVANEHGWFYHWINIVTGERTGATFDSARLAAPEGKNLKRPRSEVSTSDSTWLVAGALTARQYFHGDSEITALATRIYERMDYQWMRNGHPTLLAHGWMPESGFLEARYEKYCQLAAMYLLGIASPTHALKPESWYAWERNPSEYGGFRYIGSSLLWTYQYPFAWFDLRDRAERRTGIDWFANSATATRAHRKFCIDLGYSDSLWGVTSSLSKGGYKAWGGPPKRGAVDGTVVPCAAAGSLMFTPELSLTALRAMKEKFGEKAYGRYGFADAFHPATGWVAEDVIGLDVGITLLAAENLRSGNVWKWFMANPEAQRALELAELRPIKRGR